MVYTDSEIERLYNIKLSKYAEHGIEVSDELDDVLYEEAVREILVRSYINDRGKRNGLQLQGYARRNS